MPSKKDVKLGIQIKPEYHKYLKLKSVLDEKSIRSILEEMIEESMKKDIKIRGEEFKKKNA